MSMRAEAGACYIIYGSYYEPWGLSQLNNNHWYSNNYWAQKINLEATVEIGWEREPSRSKLFYFYELERFRRDSRHQRFISENTENSDNFLIPAWLTAKSSCSCWSQNINEDKNRRWG